MKNLLIRTLTGAVFTAAIIGSIYWNVHVFAGLFLVITFLSAAEFFKLVSHEKDRPQWVAGLVIASVAYTFFVLHATGHIPGDRLLLLIPLVIFPAAAELYRRSEHPFRNIALTLTPLFYIAFPLASLSYLFVPKGADYGAFPNIAASFFFITWTADTMAYLGGMALGKHRLFERISPKKSWEGSITGALFAVGMGIFLSFFFKELTLIQWVGMALIIVVSSTFGDLAESMLKRSAGVKDSGTLLPGHGGFLDRFDGVLFSAPCVFLYLYLINYCL